MKVDIGPLSLHARFTGRVVENDDGSMDCVLETRDGQTGHLFLSTNDVNIMRTRCIKQCGTLPERSKRYVTGRD